MAPPHPPRHHHGLDDHLLLVKHLTRNTSILSPKNNDLNLSYLSGKRVYLLVFKSLFNLLLLKIYIK